MVPSVLGERGKGKGVWREGAAWLRGLFIGAGKKGRRRFMIGDAAEAREGKHWARGG